MLDPIKLTPKKEATFVKFFTNHMPSSHEGESFFTYAILDNYNNLIKITEDPSEKNHTRNTNNNFQHTNSIQYQSGYTFYRDLNYNANTVQKNNLINQFEREVNNYVNQLTGTNLSPTVIHVQFEKKMIDDLYVDIGLLRSVDILNTLSVRNTLQGEWTEQESKTGVVIGKLVAIQKLFDSNGNRIEIPLKNCPVSIFNPSETFPTASDIDIDGNRLSLNVISSAKPQDYFDQISYETDLNYLRDYSSVENIPNHFKYTCTTNDNGEFILYDIPVGLQTFVFEVDLLKQGLSKDEVSLNFFPYPTEENPIVDTVPHFIYKQIQINVLPSWGTFGSGYTFYNFRVPNLDLRKWITYIIPPITYKKLTQEQNFFTNKVRNPLQVLVRDMTKDNFEIKKVQVVEIEDMYDRDYDQNFLWQNIGIQSKDKAEFRTNGYHAIKLPSNLYDPNGIGSNGQKGVWIGAYQLKMKYVNSEKVTGLVRYEYLDSNNTWQVKVKSHFDLNNTATNTSFLDQSFVGVFPYEQKWSLSYPEPYKIPKRPVLLNPNKTFDTNGEPISFLEPTYLDGDLVGGDDVGFGANGYGLQDSGSIQIPNEFSRNVTSREMYKYEEGIRWDEAYSNGYIPNDDPNFRSKVIDGEKYQRLEAGYGYMLIPFGWPRIKNTFQNGKLVDKLLESDFNSLVDYPLEFNGRTKPSYAEENYVTSEGNITIKMDEGLTGQFDIYRISNSVSVLPRLNPFLQKFVKLNFQQLLGNTAVNGVSTNRPNLAGNILANNTVSTTLPGLPVRYGLYFELQNLSVIVWNLGSVSSELTIGTETKLLNPSVVNGLTTGWFGPSLSSEDSIIFPANDSYDIVNNCFNSASYQIELRNTTSSQVEQPYAPYANNTGDNLIGSTCIFYNLQADDENNVPEYYLNSRCLELLFTQAPNGTIDQVQRMHVNGVRYGSHAGSTDLSFEINPINTPYNFPPFLPYGI